MGSGREKEGVAPGEQEESDQRLMSPIFAAEVRERREKKVIEYCVRA